VKEFYNNFFSEDNDSEWHKPPKDLPEKFEGTLHGEKRWKKRGKMLGAIENLLVNKHDEIRFQVRIECNQQQGCSIILKLSDFEDGYGIRIVRCIEASC
jgi:hypothetical protein